MLYEIICWNVASGFSYLYAWGPEQKEVHTFMAPQGTQRIEKGQKGNCCGAVGFGFPHERHLPAFLWPKHCGIFHVCFRALFATPYQFLLSFPFLFFCPVSLRWKDQIRSSVKIARQRFACQGISFCYLYWNIIRFTLSPFAHLTLTLPFPLPLHFHFHLNFHFTEAMLEIDSDSDSFSIRFVSI